MYCREHFGKAIQFLQTKDFMIESACIGNEAFGSWLSSRLPRMLLAILTSEKSMDSAVNITPEISSSHEAKLERPRVVQECPIVYAGREGWNGHGASIPIDFLMACNELGNEPLLS